LQDVAPCVESQQENMPKLLIRSGPISTLALAVAIGLTPLIASAAVHTSRHDGPVLPAEASRPTLADALRSVVVIGPGDPQAGPASGSGSGFVFTDEGHVMTNAHVVGSAATVSVTFIDGRRFQAAVVGVDPRTDIAVVRLPADAEAVPLTLAGPDQVHLPGAQVYALGNPLGYAFSVTSGVISGEGRTYDVITPVDFLQHDAALNPGSSGGPLVDIDGLVLGVNTATPAETIFDIGIGLAIPGGLASQVGGRLIAEGSIVRGALGLRVSHADRMVAAALGAGDVEGALIDSVEPGGASAQAGLRAGDLLLAIDHQAIAYPRDVMARTMSHGPGHRVTVDFVRSGRPGSAIVTLERDSPTLVGRVGLVAAGGAHDGGDLGLRVGPEEGRPGAVVTDVVMGSRAQNYGLAPGDRVVAVNGMMVASPEEVRAWIGGASGSLVVLRVERPGVGLRHVSIPRTPADSVSRRPGLASEQQSPLL